MSSAEFATEYLQVRDLAVTYRGGARALRNVSLDVPARARVALLGANGAGKTTLARAIVGVLGQFDGAITGGSIGWRAKDVSGWSPRKAVRRGVAYIPEGRMLIPDMTVHENLVLGTSAIARNDAEQIDVVYDMFPILRVRRDGPAGLLSGGEQQMVAIGRALMSRPRLIVADELSLGLGPILFKGLLQSLREISDALGASVLLIEQNATASLRFAEYAYMLRLGEIATHGAATDLLQHDGMQDHYWGARPHTENAT